MSVKKQSFFNLPMGNKKAGFTLSVNFLVTLIIVIAIFTSSLYLVKRFYTGAEKIKETYDQRTVAEIERLLDDGSRVAIPFDKKTIYNGKYNTFGIGVLNTLNIGSANDFNISFRFSKAYTRTNSKICDRVDTDTANCGKPDEWLQTTSGFGTDLSGVHIVKSVRNNDQEKFLLGVGVEKAPKGTYIIDLNVSWHNNSDPVPANWDWVQYDRLHKLYIEVP